MSKGRGSEGEMSGNFNIICQGTEIIGTINADSDFRIDGTVEGNINCKGKLVIGEKAHIKGDINARFTDIMGKVEGGLVINDLLTIKSTAIVLGNIQTKKLSVEVGARFTGNCQMSDTPEVISK